MNHKIYTRLFVLILSMTTVISYAFVKNDFENSPMKLLSFNVIKHDGKVEIFWETNSGNNTNYITIERSKNGKDFSKVAVIDMDCSTNSILQYLETDYQPLKGISYYRLKHTDLNDQHSYSDIVMVNSVFDKNNKNTTTHLLTSSDPKMNLENLENTEILVVLRDSNGNEFYTKILVTIQSSEIIVTASENELDSGTYIVTSASHMALYSQKLTVR